jgi:predicted kinase
MLARRVGAVYLRVDTIEQGLRDLCAVSVQGEGYRLSYRVAADNLNLGVSVIADSCNPIELTRDEWEQVALGAQARYVNIEMVCSNKAEHRRRVERRIPSIPGLKRTTWEEVEKREYHPWARSRIVVDTADRSETACLDVLLS